MKILDSFSCEVEGASLHKNDIIAGFRGGDRGGGRGSNNGFGGPAIRPSFRGRGGMSGGTALRRPYDAPRGAPPALAAQLPPRPTTGTSAAAAEDRKRFEDVDWGGRRRSREEDWSEEQVSEAT